MKENQFKIFVPENKFILSADIIMFSIWIFNLGLAYVLYRFESPLVKFPLIIIVLSFLVGAGLRFNQQSRRKNLNGRFSGIIEFNKENIIINNQEFKIDDINKIEFGVFDYLDYLTYQGKSFNPALSNGVDNTCLIKTVNGESIKILFQQVHENDFLKNREIIIHYHLKGKFSFLILIQLLGIDKYEEIQKFKKELPPTSYI